MMRHAQQRRVARRLAAGSAGLVFLAAVVSADLPRTALSADVQKILIGAKAQIGVTVSYDPRYVRLAYPGGDVPMSTGVCSDVVVRAFRSAGVDLQRGVHEDMKRSFRAYPNRWGVGRPDRNIDHRRVPNLMVFFQRAGKALPISRRPADYRPGDIVAWDLGRGLNHIGMVSDEVERRSGRPLIIHNIGAGTRAEDVLFTWKIIGHYRYFK